MTEEKETNTCNNKKRTQNSKGLSFQDLTFSTHTNQQKNENSITNTVKQNKPISNFQRANPATPTHRSKTNKEKTTDTYYKKKTQTKGIPSWDHQAHYLRLWSTWTTKCELSSKSIKKKTHTHTDLGFKRLQMQKKEEKNINLVVWAPELTRVTRIWKMK